MAIDTGELPLYNKIQEDKIISGGSFYEIGAFNRLGRWWRNCCRRETPPPEHIKVMENGKERTLRTLGDKWSYLQRVKFGANAQPFYVLIDNDGQPLNKSYSFDENVANYVDFLETGLKNYKK